MKETAHIPVLLEETIAVLDPRPGETAFDGTVGSGGHALAIAEKMGGRGTLIATDLDEANLAEARAAVTERFSSLSATWVRGNYADARSILNSAGVDFVDVLLLDLGFSSAHLISGRGFSFAKPEEELDMRYDTTRGVTAADIVNGVTESELAEIFWKYGEEGFSRRIAKAIVEARKKGKISRVGELTEIVDGSLPASARRKINPATKIFQALRIAVNGELDNLQRLLGDLPEVVGVNGRAAIISFHSLEDRMVKNAFRDLQKSGEAELINKKPVVPKRSEVLSNPRSRSAKLRAVRMTGKRNKKVE
jgi:16S rRNA (cytosine1402-N4)-methyltransferase